MKKTFVILVLFGMTYYEQSFCPGGPKYHLKRLNTPKHWQFENERQKREHQEDLQARMHKVKQQMMEKRRKKKVNQVLREREVYRRERELWQEFSRMFAENRKEQINRFARQCGCYCKLPYLGAIV